MNENMEQQNNAVERNEGVFDQIFNGETVELKNFEGVDNEVMRTKATLAQFNSDMLRKVREGLPPVDHEAMAKRTQELKEKFGIDE